VNLIQYVLVGLMVAWTLIALGCLLLIFLSFRRDPPSWWVQRHIPAPDDPAWTEKASRR
jgi:hypothetical protein